jgi:hypothetical protein
MQMTKLLLLATISIMGIMACRKTTNTSPPASVTVVNALAQGKTIIPVFGTDPITFFYSAKSVAYSAAAYYAPLPGYNPLYIVKNTDTTQPIFRSDFDFASGNIYSLFLSGDTTNPDAYLIQDFIPQISDTAAAIRFVNLSPASQAINVNIKGNGAAKTEFSGIGYRQISDFKTYPGGSAVTGQNYIFEIRNQPNDSLLVTYTWTYTRFRSHTLVFAGAVNAAGKPASLKIFPVNNY